MAPNNIPQLQKSESENELSDDMLVEYNLSLTIDQRLLNHQMALETFNELKRARQQIYGEFEFTSEAPARIQD